MATNNSIKNYELVEWTDDLNRGIEIIDQQHKHWICILNKLIKGKNQRWVVGSVLDELIDYTQYHFKTEEELYEKYGYPILEREKHQEYHNMFVERIQEIRRKFLQQKTQVIGDELLSMMGDWLINHIKHADKAACEFIKKNMKTKKKFSWFKS